MKNITIFAISTARGSGRAIVHYWVKGEWRTDRQNVVPEVITITEGLKRAHVAAATRNNLVVYVAADLDTVDEELLATVHSPSD